MVGNKNSGRPGGNPDIAKGVRKTGPKTLVGKAKSIISSGLLKNGTHSKVIRKMRSSCAKCPLGETEKVILIKGKKESITQPAVCSYYEKNKTKCEFPVSDYVSKLKNYFQFIETERDMDLQRILIFRSISDAELARETEIIKKGLPSFYTKEHMDLAMKYNSELIKTQTAQKHLHVHTEGDLAKKMLESIKLGEDDEE